MEQNKNEYEFMNTNGDNLSQLLKKNHKGD
jgi:hypothetical protein